jgi:glycerophosphoryl diester phosphodiesterase
MCMISAASSYDKLKNEEARKAAYRSIVLDGAPILETDFPIEVVQPVIDLTNRKSPKRKFFRITK